MKSLYSRICQAVFIAVALIASTSLLSAQTHLLNVSYDPTREFYEEYNRLFAASEAGVQPPYEPSWSRAVYHLYVVRTEDREGMMAHLGKAGIGTGIHYPIPLHRQRAYESLGYKVGDFPVTEKVASQIVSLPMFPNLTAEQQGRVVNEVARFPQAAMAASK